MRTLNLMRRHAGKPGAVERAAAALRSRGIGKPPLTLLEAEVLARVSLGQDPWQYHKHRGSRPVSQAMQRIHRKGFIAYNANPGGRDRVTDAGHAALLQTFRWALAQRIHP